MTDSYRKKRHELLSPGLRDDSAGASRYYQVRMHYYWRFGIGSQASIAYPLSP